MASACIGCGKKVERSDVSCSACGRFLLADRRPPASLLLRTLLIVGIPVVLIVANVVAFSALDSRKPSVREASAATTLRARELHPIVEKWVVDHPQTCPTLDGLREAKEISGSTPVTDEWGAPYRIACDFSTGEVYVKSDGPDRRAGTADDIVVPPR